MGERNVVSWTALLVAYINIGDFVEAKRVFDVMPESNVATWNSLIGGLVKIGDLRNARKLFDEMRERDVVSYTTMIDGYAKAGDMASARFLFEQAPERDVVAWTALISGRSEIDVRQSHVMAALIDMNAKCGNVDRAAKLFEEIPKRDLISYCSMIQGLVIHGQDAQAIELFNKMISEGLIPDEVAFTIVLNACSRAGLVEEGWHYFETMKNEYSIVPTPDHYACMIDLLSRKGRLKVAYELLKSMPVEPHAGAWGALLGACKLHSDVELGKEVAARLFELEPLNAGNYVLLSNIYAAAEQWLDVSLIATVAM
ncbi:hypothetical protein COLO4_29656 [Corchorus olitorius]|uniref:Pentatricopeptide repeat-containing protein n=1 Tax=Corchorus olitorius TaxID=93759 RepID=A0A1R3HDQ3_9ROSI|nr:hypothetical protein COLO4_29656 [Corchorus olitorius]